MKKNVKGFMLIETLLVTSFVAGVLIFLFIQFSNLSTAYDESYIYNTVEGLYALDDVVDYIKTDNKVINYIQENIETLNYIDITDCSLFTSTSYCNKLFELENIDKIFISKNNISFDITGYDDSFNSFIKKIHEESNEPYRIVAKFKNNMYATVRFEV